MTFASNMDEEKKRQDAAHDETYRVNEEEILSSLANQKSDKYPCYLSSVPSHG